ncbi:MAG: hypothetical protein Q9191_005184 [Dirinaria sp. TL-2023a]
MDGGSTDEGLPPVKLEGSPQTLPFEGQDEPSPDAPAGMGLKPETPSGGKDMSGSGGQHIESAQEAMDSEDLKYHKDLETLAPASATAAGDAEPISPSPKANLKRYQKHFSTPKTTRSMTQSSRENQPQSDADEYTATTAAPSMDESDMPRISAFAKLEFDDGEFYMNTYSVELGRDLFSARQALHKAGESDEVSITKRRKRSASSGDVSYASHRARRKRSRHHHPSSVVSENGGVIAVDRSDSESGDGLRLTRPSTSSSSQQMSRKSSMLFAPKIQTTDYQALAMASLLGVEAFQLYGRYELPIPSPEACPLIPIHPPVSRELQTDDNGQDAGEGPSEDAVGSHKAISRKHVKIAFDFEKHYFQIHVLGRNGAYVDDEFCAAGDIRPLTNGSLIQIGGVSVKFQLPDVPVGDTGAESNTSPDYVSGGRLNFAQHTSMESSSEDRDREDAESAGESDVPVRRVQRVRKPAKKQAPEKAAPTKSKSGKASKRPPEPEPLPPTQKRKGPGRPPKNGIMSKREQAILARQAKEEARAGVQKGANGVSKEKPRKDSPEVQREATNLQPNGKRKYTKRKSKGDAVQEQQGARESTERTDSVAPEKILEAKPAKEKKPSKPPRSPSPVIDKNSLTEEQLAKPTASYVVLIHEALTEHAEAGKGPMSLHQIYSAIARKYPYFKFVVTTVGWQSSIRHNLLQHEAFEKMEREGKGWMWGLKPGVSIEKEKKRRAPSPQAPPHQFYPHHMLQHQQPYNSYYTGMPLPPNGVPYPHYGPPAAGLPPYMHPGTHPPPGYAPAAFPLPQRPNGPLPIINAAADTSSTYQSPYGPSSQNGQQPQAMSNTRASPVPNGNETTTTSPNPQDLSSSNPPQQDSKPQPPPTPQQQQQQLPKSALPPQACPTAAPIPADTPPETRQFLDRFRASLLREFPDKIFGEHLLSSAIARVLGTQTYSTLPGYGAGTPDHPQEVALMTSLRASLDGMRRKAKGADAEAPAAAARPGMPEESSSKNEVASTNEEDKPREEERVLRDEKEKDVEASEATKEIPPAAANTDHVTTNGVLDPAGSEAPEKGKSVPEGEPG